MPGRGKIARSITWIVLCVTLSCVIIVPLGYYYLSYRHVAAVLENDARIAAISVTDIITSNPEMWEFEQLRLGELLSRRANRGYEEKQLILNAKEEVVTEISVRLDPPVIERKLDLMDSGVLAGKIVVQRSLRPLLIRTLFIGVVSFSIGIVAFLFIRIIPLRALERREKALRESEKKYRDLFENANDAIFLTSSDHSITDANTAAVSMLGYSAKEMKDMKFFDLLTPEKIPAPEASPGGSKTDPGSAKYLGRVKTKWGQVLDVEVSSSLIVSDTNVKGSRNIVRDMTERRQMEKELQRAQKLESIGVLARGIAHDFNNILTAILGNISMMKRHLAPGEEAYERLIEAENASRRAKDLTHQLLTFSKGGTLVKKTSSIVKIIRDSASLALLGSNVRCELLMDNSVWPVDIDEGQMTQVMNNLLINADQAMPDGGVVRISAENIVTERDLQFPTSHRKYVKLTIQDEGIGISSDHLEKIFDPYFTTKQKGSGLGLAITFSIIKKHDGHITVKSELEAGTAFTIYLPASRKQIVHEAPVERMCSGPARRVLLMDDEKIMRDVTGAMLKSEGHEVGFAVDGNEAVGLYKTAIESGRPFDVVILDLTVPGGMGGKETIKRLIEIDFSVKAIVSSGYTNDPVMSDYKNYGFSDFLVKPYTIQELNQAILTALSLRPQSRT